MKGITTLLLVAALLVFGFGDTFAAKKTQGNPRVEALSPLVESQGVITQQDVAPLPPARRASAMFVPIVPGTYTIGAAGTYATISAAVAALNANGIDSTLVGNIIFEFIDASYTDTSQTIGPYPGQYGANLVIFRPAAANVATIKVVGGVASLSFCFRLNNANNVTFDGSNSGGSDRSLSIVADTTGITRNAMLIQKGSKNVVVKNCNLVGNRRSASSASDVLRIVNTGFAAFGGQNNITIQNNHIYKGLNGIDVIGAGTATLVLDTNMVITGNLVGGGSSPDMLDHIFQFGMYLQGMVNGLVENNDVNGLVIPTVAGSGFGGIRAENACVNLVIRKNNVHNMLQLAGAGRPNAIILGSGSLAGGSTRSTIYVYNNFIYDLRNLGLAATRALRGLALAPLAASTVGNGLTAYVTHNTFHFYTDLANDQNTAFGVETGAFGGGAAPDTCFYSNNIISFNRQVGFSRQYLFFQGLPGMFNWFSNNNTFYRPDGGAFGQWTNNPFPTGPDAVVSTLADWQSNTGNDLASVEGNPELISDVNLHINTTIGIISAADSVGAAGTGIATDIDGAVRDASFPDAGAVEFALTRYPTDLQAMSVDFPSPTQILAASAAFSPTGTFRNRGTATLTSASSVICQILDAVPSVVYSGPATISVGGYDNTTQITFPSVSGGLAAGAYTIRVIAAIGGDAISSNDTVTSTLAVQASIASGSFPYLEDFEDPSPETAGAGWVTASDPGSPNDWVIGTPTKTQISGAHSGTKSLVTKTTGDYSIDQSSFIFPPILDLSAFTDVLLVQFYMNFQAENEWDGADLQMSTDGGFSWVKVDSAVGTGGNFNTTNSTAWYNVNFNNNAVPTVPFWSGGTAGDGGIGSAGYSSADAGDYIRVSTAVSGVAGLSDVRFRLHFATDGSAVGEGFSIDDWSFSALASDDIGVSSVGIAGYLGGPVPNRPAVKGKKGADLGTLPNSTNRPSAKSLGAVVAGSAIDFETIAKNYGANTQASYSVGLNIDGAGADADVNTDPLGFGDDDTLTLSWAGPTTGIHTADAWTTLAGDALAANDTATFDFEVLAPEVVFYEGFNSGTWPSPGWDTLDIDGVGVQPASWQQDVLAPYEGAHSAGGIYLSSNGSFQIDDWLISPNTGGLLDISYTVDSLSFYMGAPVSIYADSVEILVSTTGTAVSDFTTSLGYVMVPMGSWTKFTYALPNAATRYIAFRYLLSDALTNGNGFGLDNVRITRYNFANDITITPGSINYGLVPSGFGSAETVKVNNNGNVALAISSVASDNADYTVVPGAGVIPPGDSANFVVTFTPSTIGVIAGNIVFTSDADSSPDTVTVSGIGGAPLNFVTLSPDSVFNEDPLKPGKSKKPAKHQKHLFPNWSNLIDELNAQGGFGPATSESDSAGGMVIGHSYMYSASPATPLTPKWKAVKDSANKYCWVRLAKWDFKKNIGKSSANIQKTLRDKVIGFHTGPARGLDTTTDGKFKFLKKQLTSLSPKKQNNKLFAELVALKVNIAASAMGKTPAGFGDLIYDMSGSPYDEMSVSQISGIADSLMTHYFTATIGTFDSLYSAAYNINRSCVGALDTASFDAVDSVNIKGKLTLYGQVNIATVPFLKLPPMPFVATRIKPLNSEVESPEDFDDEGDFDVESMPVAAQLMQNYPNPFNPSTTIAFRLKEVSKVTVKIFNLLGQEVAVLVNGEELEEGAQSLQFSAEMLSSGVYFYRIEAQGLEDAALKTVETRKMMLLK